MTERADAHPEAGPTPAHSDDRARGMRLLRWVDALRPDAAGISRNFAAARGFSILMVVTSHYFSPSLLWVGSTVALFVFAFSSAHFTTEKYGTSVSIGRFWKSKFERLGWRLLTIAVFLAVVFLGQGESGMLTWQTLVAVTGLSGFLTWFGIPNPSPYGMGVWFLTLLLIFYAAYPLLARGLARPGGPLVGAVIAVTTGIVLEWTVPMGHMLWMTAGAFVLGVCWVLAGWAASPARTASLIVLAVCTIAAGYTIGAAYRSELNIIGLFALSLACVQALFVVPLPRVVLTIGAWLGVRSLEIYLIHTYLFVGSEHFGPAVGYLASVAIVIPSAWALHALASAWRLGSGRGAVSRVAS
ncbi:MAG: acyltransferase [Spiribacter salinus]|uniref:Acyltransferase n=1 Tax=Spiribacter salinus TaxID=1335746 RepID=A0A540VVD1_9GAMM|nr:MAG: acyltransferase [Spiribacter salinus]